MKGLYSAHPAMVVSNEPLPHTRSSTSRKHQRERIWLPAGDSLPRIVFRACFSKVVFATIDTYARSERQLNGPLRSSALIQM